MFGVYVGGWENFFDFYIGFMVWVYDKYVQVYIRQVYNKFK